MSSHRIKNSIHLVATSWTRDVLPVQLKTGNVTIDSQTNRLMFRLTKRTQRVRYCSSVWIIWTSYEINEFLCRSSLLSFPVLHRPGGRISINTSFLFDRLQRLQSRPVLGSLVTRMLQKYDVDLDDLSGISEGYGWHWISSIDVLVSIPFKRSGSTQTVYLITVFHNGISSDTTVVYRVAGKCLIVHIHGISKMNTSHASLCILQMNLESGDSRISQG